MLTATPHRTAIALPAPVTDRAAALLTAFAMVLGLLLTGAVAAKPASANSVEGAFTAKINDARSSRGLPRLSTRSSLVSVARAWASSMAGQAKLYHNPNLTRQVSNWRWVGENVGYGPDADTVHVAFMSSPAHKANILDRDYTEVGVGSVTRNGRVWVAEVFRRPQQVTTSAVRSTFHSLRMGSTGHKVTKVQSRLGVPRTGRYNRTTRTAVSKFQQRQGWRGRGNVGRKTWARLF